MARGDEKGAFNGIQFAAGQGYPLGGLKTSLSDIKASGLDTQVLIGVKRQILFKSNATPGKSEIAADHDGGIGSFLILGNEQTHITARDIQIAFQFSPAPKGETALLQFHIALVNAAYGYGSFLLGIIRGIDNHSPLVYSRIIVLVSRIHSDGKTGGCGSP
ncbi:hypothetical protein, partial [uncultured Desulfovibrio sp.]|uniref:hypothetical protein n=1 Tax=uncultured Desulfovibrio sp. TaxID=167968 RepID=UPI00263B43E7